MQKGADKAKSKPPQLFLGMKDILQTDEGLWEAVRYSIENFAQQYGYERIDTPLLEEEGVLRVISRAEEGDAVPPAFLVLPNGKRAVVRTEGLAPALRAFYERGLQNGVLPSRLYSFCSFLKSGDEKVPVKQQHEFFYTVIGDAHPVNDALLIQLASHLYADAEIPITLEINSVGHKECRDGYVKAIAEYYKPRKNALCENCKRDLQKNPFKLFTCDQHDCQMLLVDSPQIVDHLCQECNQHFVSVLEYLDSVDVPYFLNPRFLPVTATTTRTAFRIHLEQDHNVELGSGGRYDQLAEVLGFTAMPVAAFVGSMERFVQQAAGHRLSHARHAAPDVFIAQLGENARKRALKLLDQLRRMHIRAAELLSKDGLVPQMARATKLGAPYTLIIGQKEMMDDTIIIRDMENGIQEIFDFQKVAQEIQKRLAKRNGNNHRENQISRPPSPSAKPMAGAANIKDQK